MSMPRGLHRPPLSSSYDTAANPQGPVAPGTVELSSLGSPLHSPLHPSPPTNTTSVCSCLSSCWSIISWTFSIVTYIMELFVYVWVSYVYATGSYPQRYYLFGLSVGFLVFPTVLVATVSLVWYYNLDRFHRRRRERDPHNMEFIEYKKKFTISALLLHILLLGVVYRYSQLIYLTLIGKRMNLPYLRRDAILVRFFHAFLSSAPHLVVHLYATIVAFFPSSSSPSVNAMEPAVLSALAISAVSMLYTLLSFALNDRVSGKTRRVIFPAHVTQVLWHVCMVASRVLAFALFGYVYDYYVVAVIGGHWLLMVFVLLLERTTFCADIERQANGELKFTRRLCLEIPFDILAAAVYVFVYFNPKRGRTRVWASIYHFVTLAENVVMGALFFVYFQNVDKNDFDQPPPFYLVISGLAAVAGLYLLGIIFMIFYYLLYHPKRTGKCFWIGIPRKCLFCCSQRKEGGEEVVTGTKYHHRNSGIIISGPTLVSHNGFVPKNLLPVGPNATISSEASISQLGGGSIGNGHARDSRDRSVTEPVVAEGPRAPPSGVGANVGSETTQDLGTSLTLVSPYSSRTNTARTASESIPAFSDILPSELDTDISSNPVDTVIDTPLFGTTPDVGDVSESRQTRTRFGSQDTESQKTCTNDTGIDVDSDLQLSPGVMGCDMEDSGRVAEEVTSPPNGTAQQHAEATLPVFVDNPVKPRKSKGSLEMHYFPNEEEPNSEMPLQAFATAAAPSRDSVTPTLPTPTYTPSPTSTPNTTRVQWRYPSEGSEDVFQPNTTSSPQTIRRESSPPSQPSPDRTRRAPRSPIGARSFQVNNDDMDLSQNSQHSSHTPSQPRAVTPRSPKGARRLLVQQSSPVPAAQSRRQPPPPPIPPKTTSQDTFSPPPPSSFTTATSSSNMPPPISVAAPVQSDPVARRAPPSPPKPVRSDGITRGLSSLVPVVPNRRAHSSSPNPISRHHVAQHRSGISPGRNYHRPSSFTPAYATPERVPKGVSNYKRVSAAESQLATSGSPHNLQLRQVPQRPKSDGWRVDRSAIVQPLQQQQRAPRRQSALNSHGSSSEGSTFHSSSTSSDQRVTSVSSANSVENYNRQQLLEASTRNVDAQMKRNSTSGNGYSHRTPRSAFSRVSPERSRAHHISAPQQLLENYPVTSSGQQLESSRQYPKYPQGALPNAPKLVKSPPPKGVPINVPPPLPPLRRDNSSNNEPSNTTNNAQRRGSGEYDKLPAEVNAGAGTADDQLAPTLGASGNRNSLISPSSYQASTQATHLANNRRSYINPPYPPVGSTPNNNSANVNNRRSFMGPTSYQAAGLRDNAQNSTGGASGNRRSFVSPTSFRPPQSSNHESVV